MSAPGSVIASVPAGRAVSGSGAVNVASTSTDNTVEWNAVQPTVTIDQALSQSDPTSGSPIVFMVHFSAPVTGFTNADVLLSGTAGGPLVGSVSGSGADYSVEVSGMSAPGSVIASVPAGRAVSGSGAVNVASTSSDNSVTWTGSAVTPSPRVTTGGGTLAVTGSTVTWLAASAVLLIAGGVAALLLARRRRSNVTT
jgi:LPXTG-motif cell wall-anchored protein